MADDDLQTRKFILITVITPDLDCKTNQVMFDNCENINHAIEVAVENTMDYKLITEEYDRGNFTFFFISSFEELEFFTDPGIFSAFHDHNICFPDNIEYKLQLELEKKYETLLNQYVEEKRTELRQERIDAEEKSKMEYENRHKKERYKEYLRLKAEFEKPV